MLGKIATGIAVAGLLSASSAYGEGVSVGVKAGTLGAGVELEAQMTQTLSGRLGLNYFSYSYDGTEDDIKYDFDATLQTVGALLDWHPFSNGFRISAGVMINGNELEGSAQATNGTYDIGDRTYSSGDVGTLTGDIEFNAVAPYIGIGTSTSFGKNGSFGFICDLGVMYQGEADVTFSADGILASNQTFMSDLKKEEQNLQDDLSNYEWYPVISVGFIYRF